VVDDDFGFSAGWIAPMRARLGIAHQIGRGFIALDGDIQTGLKSNVQYEDDRKFTWNARLGGRFDVSDRVAIGGGLFTDREYERFSNGVDGVDFYGAAIAIEMRSSARLAPGQGADEIVFASTFGLRYAYGKGEVSGLRLPLNPTDVTAWENVAAAMTVHEVALNLGSALYF
jgi:hypothetical protein